jgi:radical SAM protein with 4Fe4S-binding SPASM domain
VRVSFTSSGSGLTVDQADVLAKNDVFVILSVDGSPDRNDPVRKAPPGQSAFSIAERAYEMLKSRSCRVGLSVTIGSHNIDTLKTEVDYLLERFKPNDIGLNAFLHRCGNEPNPFQVNSEDAFEKFMEAFGVTKELGVYAEQPFRRLKPFVFRKPLLKDCSSPGERLVLVPGGKMGFCDSCFPDNRYFYAFDEFPGEGHPDYRLWAGLSSPEMPGCSQCPAMTVCGGACRYDAFKASGRLDGTDPERCRFERAFLNWMIWALFELNDVENDVFYVPSNQDRMKLCGNVTLQDEDQPFTAGSYSD